MIATSIYMAGPLISIATAIANKVSAYPIFSYFFVNPFSARGSKIE